MNHRGKFTTGARETHDNPTSRPDRLDKHRQKLKCMWKRGNFGGTQVHRIINQTNLTKRGQEHDKTRKNRNINESKHDTDSPESWHIAPLLEGASLHRKRGAGMGGNLERGSVGSWWGERPGRWWRRDEPGRRQEGLEAGGARRDPGHSHDSGMAADSRGWRPKALEQVVETESRWGRGDGEDLEVRGGTDGTTTEAEAWIRKAAGEPERQRTEEESKGWNEPDGAGRTKGRGTAGGVESRGVGWSTPDQGTS